MKICHVINDLSRGGAESHLYSLVKLQREAGHDISVMLLGSDLKYFFSLEENFREIEIEIVRFNGPKKLQGFNPFSIFRSINYLSKEKFDVIHSHSPRSDFLSYISNSFLSEKIRWVVTVHGKYGTYLEGNMLVDIFRKYSISILSKMWLKADVVIAISQSIEDWMFHLNIALKPTVIPYGIQLQERTSLDLSKDISIGFMGRLNKNKGIEDLIDTFKDLKKEDDFNFINAKLQIAGVGTNAYERKLKELGAYKDIKFLGYVTDRDQFFNSINLFIFSSYSEGLGLVLLEAMSYGVLCVSRDIEPMNNIIIDRKNGYLFSNNEELKDIINFINNISTKDKENVVNNAIKKIENSYSIMHMYLQIEEVYGV